MMIKFLPKTLNRKRKKITGILYITILISIGICTFLFKKMQEVEKEHSDHNDNVEEAVAHLSRFKALKNKTVNFYKYCLYHALMNYKGKYASPQASLSILRNYYDFSYSGNIVTTGDTTESGYLKLPLSKILTNENASISVTAAILNKLQNDGRTFDSVLNTAQVIAPNGDTLKPQYLKSFIPLLADSMTQQSDIIDWIYSDRNYDKLGRINLVATNNYATSDIFSDKHYLVHESEISHFLLLKDNSGDSLNRFLEKRFLEFSNNILKDEQFIKSDVYSSVNFFGFAINFGFLLYLIGPVIAGLFVFELFLGLKIQSLGAGHMTRYNFRLFNYSSLLPKKHFHPLFPKTVSLIETIVRWCGIALLLYGTLFRFNYIGDDNIPYNQFMRNHLSFEFIDVINIISLSIVLTVFSQYKFAVSPNDKTYKPGFISHLIFWTGVVFLPVIILIMSYFLFNDFVFTYYSWGSIIFMVVFITILSALFLQALKNKDSTIHYVVIAGVIVFGIGATFLAMIPELF